MKRRALLAALFAAVAAPSFGDDAGDAEVFAQLVQWAQESGLAAKAPGARMQAIATHPLLLGRPYQRGPLEGADEILRAGFAAYDCVTFVETVLALSRSLAQPQPDWDEYCQRLTAIRYRGGQRSYCTRLHYFGDWARANVEAGRLVEFTRSITLGGQGAATAVAPAHYRVLGEQLAKSKTVPAPVRAQCIAIMESNLARELPGQSYLPTASLPAIEPALQAGDLLAWVAARRDVDVVHLSLVVAQGERRGLVHASLREGRVAQVGDVAAYGASLREALGVRVFRVV